ncbi:hypothetical protein BVY02_02610, partial [bacterium J17]
MSIDGANNTTIKGLAINNFDGDGVLVTGSGTGNKIQGSYIGVWFDGTSDAGNTGSGVYVNLTSETIIGSNGDGTGEAWERNLIAANDSYGVYVSGTTTSVAGNFLGVTYEGSVALGNAGGVFINSSYAVIGTNNDGTNDSTEGNVSSGHSGTGIYITGTGSTANTIAGNYIGVGQDGSLDLGNGTHGIWLLSSASDNTIGGVDNDTVNVIAYNGDAASEYGVYLSGANTDNNKIYRNTIYSNQSEGIKLAFDGANDNQVAPAIIKNVLNGTTTNIIGTTEASGLVQLFEASADNEGQSYLGE